MVILLFRPKCQELTTVTRISFQNVNKNFVHFAPSYIHFTNFNRRHFVKRFRTFVKRFRSTELSLWVSEIFQNARDLGRDGDKDRRVGMGAETRAFNPSTPESEAKARLCIVRPYLKKKIVTVKR